MENASWRLILYLSLAGLGLGSYLTVVTFVTADLSYCEPHPLFSCDTVITSSYSRLLGVPVALLGTLGFLGVFLTSYGGLIVEGDTRRRLALLGLVLAGAGLAFGIYLTYLELFVIQSVCLLCLATFTLMIPIFYLFLRVADEERGRGA
ncbi:MAG: vitamin K epoxide reductase family protein [Candidatus Thermoplasmatota archaeon]|nr:vitamin K epoxide reductase family protein [Candidatus Thermoplasmatota archaeon]